MSEKLSVHEVSTLVGYARLAKFVKTVDADGCLLDGLSERAQGIAGAIFGIEHAKADEADVRSIRRLAGSE